MADPIPPLPELEITEGSKSRTDQKTVDNVLRIVHAERPDLFEKFAEKERYNLGVDEYGDDFLDFVSLEVRKKIEIANPSLAAGAILLEARRRARMMYGIPPYREINVKTGEYE